ncbi:MAG: threonine synthase [Coriobacteriales bacterium]|jgi:threonine synthase|nr:threonine synthase [Coriobacteriales bacterium]
MRQSNNYTNTYIDTRGTIAPASALPFTQTIIKGIASGGGLFVPVVIPHLTLDEIAALADMPYWQRAATIYKCFGVDLPNSKIDELMQAAYGSQWDDSDIAPVRKISSNTHVLELWHGPTSAFKDMALQCLPLFFSASIAALREHESDSSVDVSGKCESESLAKELHFANCTNNCNDDSVNSDVSKPSHDYLILVATSGDTGKAALEGFANRDFTKIIVFYPDGGVSDIQYLQMATQQGNNVGVFGLSGNFDDCQRTVKQLFTDEDFCYRLASEHNILLSSANSINWGRLLPQIVYYVSAYADLVAKGDVAVGEQIDICVPTGNFGNILAAWYAKQIGTPIGRLFCASNENRVLADFINSGTYDITNRDFVQTPSPSMDILVSSNLERQLFELCGRNCDAINNWMRELREQGRFQIDRETFANLRQDFGADWVSSEESLLVIKEVYQKYGYLLDPHSAIGWKVAERLRDAQTNEEQQIGSHNQVLIVSTAHWAKFGADVYRALNDLAPDASLPKDVACLGGMGINKLILEKLVAQNNTKSATIPKGLSELDSLNIRFKDVVNADLDAARQTVLEWLRSKDGQ